MKKVYDNKSRFSVTVEGLSWNAKEEIYVRGTEKTGV